MAECRRDLNDRQESASPPPGERLDRRGRTRAALLGAAERMWAEHGIHGASLDDIATAAGLTKGAVYSNFAGKTHLLLALLERYAGKEVETTVDGHLLDTGCSLEERIQRAGEEYERRIGTAEMRLLALLTVEFWLHGMRDQAARRHVADWHDSRRGHLAELLTETGDISSADRAALAIAVDCGLMFQHLLDPDRVPARLYATGMRLVLTG